MKDVTLRNYITLPVGCVVGEAGAELDSRLDSDSDSFACHSSFCRVCRSACSIHSSIMNGEAAAASSGDILTID